MSQNVQRVDDPEFNAALVAMTKCANALFDKNLPPPGFYSQQNLEQANKMPILYATEQKAIYVAGPLYQAALQNPKVRDAVTVLMAHEMAHRYLGHKGTEHGCEAKRNELKADVIGGKIYGDIARYREITKSFYEVFSESPQHPSGKDRLEVMDVALGTMEWKEVGNLIGGKDCKPIPSALEDFKNRHAPR